MKPLPYLLRKMRPELGGLAQAYACMLVLALATAFLAFLSGPALGYVFSNDVGDVLRTPQGALRGVWRYVPSWVLHALLAANARRSIWVVPILLVSTACLKAVAQTGQLYLMGRSSQRLLHSLRVDAFAALLAQSPAFYTKRAHGDLLSRIGADAAAVEQAFYYGAGPLLRDSLSVLMLLAFCFATDPRLACLTFITVPLAVVPLLRFTKWLKRVSKVSQSALGDINAVCYEALAGIRVVQAFGCEAHEVQRLRGASARYMQQMLTAYLIRAVRTPTTEVLGTVALAALLAMLGHQVRSHNADPAHYISFFAALIMMYDPLKKLGGVSDYLAAGSAAAERLMEIIALPSQIVCRPAPSH
jgi:subfamily B ATP-binding cassette protein MsbA